MQQEPTVPPEYLGVRHILTAPQLVRRTTPYIAEDDFDFIGLYREAATMSGGEELLVRIAGDLWNAGNDVRLSELVRRLDLTTFARVLDGFQLVRGSFAQSLGDGLMPAEEELAA
jgi:hypothetical protein